MLTREYPKDPARMTRKVHQAFKRNSGLTDAGEIEACIGKAEYMVKEFESLYMLRKYRAMKSRYYNDGTGGDGPVPRTDTKE